MPALAEITPDESVVAPAVVFAPDNRLVFFLSASVAFRGVSDGTENERIFGNKPVAEVVEVAAAVVEVAAAVDVFAFVASCFNEVAVAVRLSGLTAAAAGVLSDLTVLAKKLILTN